MTPEQNCAGVKYPVVGFKNGRSYLFTQNEDGEAIMLTKTGHYMEPGEWKLLEN